MITRRRCEGAVKYALRDLRRDECVAVTKGISTRSWNLIIIEDTSPTWIDLHCASVP